MFKDLGEKPKTSSENVISERPQVERYSRGDSISKTTTANTSQKYTASIQNIEQKVDLIKSNKVVVIDVWAPWCNPCLMIADKYEEMAKKYNKRGVCILAKENLEDKIQMPEGVVIKGIPTFLFFKDGVHVDTEVGADLGTVENKIQEIFNEM